MIDDRELSAMRAEANQYLPHVCTIRHIARVSDGAGGYTENVTDVPNVPCRLAPTGGSESKIAERLTAVATWTITFPAGTAVSPKDRILINGHTLEIQAVLPQGWEITRRAVCSEVSG